MFGKFGTEAVMVATSLVGLAIIAVIVGKNAKTADVIGAGFKGLTDTISAAVKPVM